MCAAMDMVSQGLMSANKAAVVYGVPPSTLKDQLSGRVQHGKNPGPRPYLDSKEEKELGEYRRVCIISSWASALTSAQKRGVGLQ